MVKRTSRYLVALTLSVIALGSIFIAGCSREEAKETPQADPPSVYMKDPVFTNALAKQRAERKSILRARDKIMDEVAAKVEAMRAKMPSASDEEIKKELEKDPEWNSLVARAKDVGQAFDENRLKTTKIVGERIAPRTKKNLK